MISFLRKIRQNLLAEGKTAKYLKYALGEIALVMIGILLALQVNAWNQTRLEGVEEKILLRNLHEEFITNKKELEKSTAIYQGAMKSNAILMNLIGSEPEELIKHNLDSLFYEALPSTTLLFSDNSIKNIIQSGRLVIIKNPEIIQLMYQWEALAVLLKERETTLQAWLNNQMIPFISDYVAFKQIDSYGNNPWTGKSKLSTDYPALFKQLKFENIEDNVLWYHHKNYSSLESANELIEKIIAATKSYSR